MTAISWSTQLLALLVLLASSCLGRIYDPCELANELRNRYAFPADQVPTWVCIAYHESRYDTTAIGRLNTDGSADHGIFQINDRYWCDQGPRGCGVTCQTLRDNMDQMTKCVKQVYAESKKLWGDGFIAWTTYKNCKEPSSYTARCNLGGGGGGGGAAPSPPQGCVSHDGVCVGPSGAQNNCCSGLYCHKNNPSWAEGRCYFGGGR